MGEERLSNLAVLSRDVDSVSRSRSRDLFLKGFGLVSVSRNLGGSRTRNQTSRSRLGLEAQGFVYK